MSAAPDPDAYGRTGEFSECWECGGRGTSYGETCVTCGGYGWIRAQQESTHDQ